MKVETYGINFKYAGFGWRAIQFDGRNWKDLVDFSNGMLMEKTTSIFGNYSKEMVKIKTDSDQLVSVSGGNYLIKSHASGRYFEIKPEDLEKYFVKTCDLQQILKK